MWGRPDPRLLLFAHELFPDGFAHPLGECDGAIAIEARAQGRAAGALMQVAVDTHAKVCVL